MAVWRSERASASSGTRRGTAGAFKMQPCFSLADGFDCLCGPPRQIRVGLSPCTMTAFQELPDHLLARVLVLAGSNAR